jgi:hypothetical protein
MAAFQRSLPAIAVQGQCLRACIPPIRWALTYRARHRFPLHDPATHHRLLALTTDHRRSREACRSHRLPLFSRLTTHFNDGIWFSNIYLTPAKTPVSLRFQPLSIYGICELKFIYLSANRPRRNRFGPRTENQIVRPGLRVAAAKSQISAPTVN